MPFIRKKELSTDETKGIDVILNTIDWFENINKTYNLLMVLQPTCPLRVQEDIDKAIELLFLKKARAIISVCEVDHHPYWANTLPKDGCMKDFLKPEIINKNRQELPNYYRLNGSIYLVYCDYIKRHKSFYGGNTFAYAMPQERSIDIDSEMDFKIAEMFLKHEVLKEKNYF